MEKLIEGPPVGVSCPADSDVLPQAQVLHLVFDPVVLPVPGTFALVGFDAADVVRGALHQRLDQTVSLFLGGRRAASSVKTHPI